MISNLNSVWTPSFGMQHWVYQSFLLLPTESEKKSPPGSSITAIKWAKGSLYLETGIDPSPAPDAVGILTFPTPEGDIKLNVKAFVEKGVSPVKFEAIGQVRSNFAKTNGTTYQLLGWAFQGVDNKVSKIEGSVIAVRGSDAHPDKDLSGRPIGTIGAFVITNT